MLCSGGDSRYTHWGRQGGCYAQEVGGTLIGEDGVVVMVGPEWVAWYQIYQNQGFHSIHAVPAIMMSRPPLIRLH